MSYGKLITRFTTGGHDIFITCPAKGIHRELSVHDFCGTEDENIIFTCRSAGNYYICLKTDSKNDISYRNYKNDMSRRTTKSNKMTCAPSEDSDQPGHPPSLIRVFTVHSEGILNQNYNATHKWLDFRMNMWCRTIYLRYSAQVLTKNHWRTDSNVSTARLSDLYSDWPKRLLESLALAKTLSI